MLALSLTVLFNKASQLVLVIDTVLLFKGFPGFLCEQICRRTDSREKQPIGKLVVNRWALQPSLSVLQVEGRGLTD